LLKVCAPDNKWNIQDVPILAVPRVGALPVARVMCPTGNNPEDS